MAAEIDIRVLSDLADFEKTLDVQAQVWGFSEIERVPSRLSVVFTKIGGLVKAVYTLDPHMAGEPTISYRMVYGEGDEIACFRDII